MNFFVYILYSPSKDVYYIGSCENVTVRLEQHNSRRNKSTKHGAPWQLKKQERYDTRAEAVKREYSIKRMKSRKFVELVIEGLR